MQRFFTKRPRSYRTGFLLALAVVCAFLTLCALTSCRYTDVLDELILDQYAEVDPNLSPMRTEQKDSDQDQQQNSLKVENADRQNDEVEDNPQYGDGSDGETDQRDHDSDSPHDDAASNGDEVDSENSGDAESGTLSDSQSSAASNAPAEGSDSTDQTSDTGEETSGGSTEGSTQDSGLGGTGKTYDNGTYEELPSVSHIAAVGPYATIVQMLGGQGALAATDETTLSSWQSSNAFSGEIDGVVVGWSEDGTSASTALIDALRASDAECVLVSTSSATFTEDEIAQLQAPREGKDGLDIVEMPNIGIVDAYDSDILLSVQIVGEMLKSAGTAIQFDAQTMADDYVKLHDEALQWTSDKNGGLSIFNNGYSGQRAWQYFGAQIFSGEAAITRASSRLFVTSYIDQWASPKYDEHIERRNNVEQTINISLGTGIYAKASGASDNAYLTLDYYLQHAGVMDTLMSTQAYAFGSSTEDLGTADFNMPYAAYRIGYNQLVYYLSSTTGTVTAGSTEYPGIIVRTSEQANYVRQSMATPNGTYNVGSSYSVWVLPSSIVSGSWADGTVESFLIAPWAFGQFQQAGDLTQCASYAQSFYQEFYRCSAQAALGDSFFE